jgi:redox-sensitive bicupin YhaK (pirin superfamily)
MMVMSFLPTNEPICIEPEVDGQELLVIEGRERQVGSFAVSRLLPAGKRRMVGPFVFIDHMGPVTISPGSGFDVGPHPHIGLSTTTYLIAGEILHRDSLGSVQLIKPGDLAIMTAGRGIVHSERADPKWREHGGLVNMVQIWLGLPISEEDGPPSFEHHTKDRFPTIGIKSGVSVRVLIGEAFGTKSPVAHSSHPLLVDLKLKVGAEIELPGTVQESALFVISGDITIGRQTMTHNHLVVIDEKKACVRANSETHVLFFGGSPLGPRFIRWNFVSSSNEKIDRAAQAWKTQTFPKIPGETDFIPLPEPFR